MPEPATKVRETQFEKAKPHVILPSKISLIDFKQTFKFDNGDTLYEDGKGNAQIRHGKEIIEEGSVVGRHGKGTFTFRTRDNYEIIFHKSGLGNLVYTPEDIKKRRGTSR